MNSEEFGSKLQEISSALEIGKELITEDSILEFQTSAKNVVAQLDGIMQDKRLLRLGIVGEVKAGKSSFLNALLFEGKDILPKAPTPMTAALTRISYSDTPRAKIVFYDVNDWNIIVHKAGKYDEQLDKLYESYKNQWKKINEKKGFSLRSDDASAQPKKLMTKEDFEKDNRERISMEYRACKELVELADARKLDVQKYLGQEQIIASNSDDEYQYLNELNEYVGSEGKYTAIVKYTEVQMSNEMLKGVEIIDTPGVNDPLSSRSRVTRDFLVECDAVFLLSYCGQFLGADDIKFITSSLPNEGINKIILIGSKMDSAILQYPSKRGASFKIAYLGTKKNCEEQAKDNIESCEITSKNEKLLTQIKSSLPPICISSVAYSAALQMQRGEKLGELESYIINQMTKRYPDFPSTVNELFALSSIIDVREKVFKETKEQKEVIIQGKINGLIDSQVSKFLSFLENIANQVRTNRNDLKNSDCEQLQTKLDILKEKLDSIRVVVKNLFETAAIESRRSIEDIAVDIGLEMRNHTNIEVVTTTETKHRVKTSGLIFTKVTEWDDIITTHTAEVKDVEDNMRQYYFSCVQMINSAFRELVKIDRLKDDVKEAVMGAFDQTDKEFDENRIILPLENALNRITLPQVELDLEKYESALDTKLGRIVQGGVAKNEDIPVLKRTQDQVISMMSQDLIEEIKKQGISIDNDLKKQSAVFIDSIVEQLEGNQKKLEVMIRDKQTSMEKLEEYLKVIKDAKQSLMEE